jgi:hypothetical protein
MISSAYRALLTEPSPAQGPHENQKQLVEATANKKTQSKPLALQQYERVSSAVRGSQLRTQTPTQTQHMNHRLVQTHQSGLPYYGEHEPQLQISHVSKHQEYDLNVLQMQQSKLQWQQQHNLEKLAQLECSLQQEQRQGGWRRDHRNKNQIQQQSHNEQSNPHQQRQHQQPTGEEPTMSDVGTVKQRRNRKRKEQQDQKSFEEQKYVPNPQNHPQQFLKPQQQQFSRVQYHQKPLELPLQHREQQQQHQAAALKTENRRKKQQIMENRRMEQQQAAAFKSEYVRQDTEKGNKQQIENRQQKNQNIHGLQKGERGQPQSASAHNLEHTRTASARSSTNLKSSSLHNHQDHSPQAESVNASEHQQSTGHTEMNKSKNRNRRNQIRKEIDIQTQNISINDAESDNLRLTLALDRVSLNTPDVFLDEYNSDLNAQIGQDGWEMASQNIPPPFRLLWAGSKANFGVRKGKVFFEVKIMQNLPWECISGCVERNAVRIGWSNESSLLALGEEPISFGFQTSRKFYVNNIYRDYGQDFNVNDVIGALLDLDSKPATISFMKNGTFLGIADSFSPICAGLDQKVVMYPHVFVKNCKIVINFGQYKSWFSPPQGFQYIGHLPLADKVASLQPPKDYRQCQVIMIIGLPGCGKTTWARKQQKENPEKRYNILGTDLLIERMGFPEMTRYSDRFNKLYRSAEACFKTLMHVAATKRRNYILDQTNVFSSAQEKKMARFEKFFRIAAVIQPNNQELERRSKERAEEQCVPPWVVREMKANYSLPTETVFDVVNFIELGRKKAQRLVAEYNRCRR